jgi:hypothetical protein
MTDMTDPILSNHIFAISLMSPVPAVPTDSQEEEIPDEDEAQVEEQLKTPGTIRTINRWQCNPVVITSGSNTYSHCYCNTQLVPLLSTTF